MPVIPSLADQSYRITLEGAEYVLRLQWSGRLEAWYLSLFDANGAPIHTRIRVVTGYRLLQNDVDPRRPPGDFYCFNFNLDYPGDSLIGLDGLGSTFRFYYLTQAEINKLRDDPPVREPVSITVP